MKNYGVFSTIPLEHVVLPASETNSLATLGLLAGLAGTLLGAAVTILLTLAVVICRAIFFPLLSGSSCQGPVLPGSQASTLPALGLLAGWARTSLLAGGSILLTTAIIQSSCSVILCQRSPRRNSRTIVISIVKA